MNRDPRADSLSNLKLLILLIISFQCIRSQPIPGYVPFNYYLANATLLWLTSEDDSFFTFGGDLPAMTISFKPSLDLKPFNLETLAVIANSSDPNSVGFKDAEYGDHLCTTVDGDYENRGAYIGYITTKLLMPFITSNCITPESDYPYLIAYGFHDVLSYDRNDIPCNRTWYYHYWMQYHTNETTIRYPLRAVYQIDMVPGAYHCNPEIYAQYQ